MSVETPDGGRCVDIFQRPDGSFGFEEFRRDAEDKTGWFAIGTSSSGVFGTEKSAVEAASNQVSWFKGVYWKS